MLVAKKAMHTRPWFHDTVIYQIYPRSFRDSNGDGIGDLQGIIESLDYLQDLGVETLWLSPFFGSPQQDFGYDVADYLGVAPEYGSVDDAHRLIRETHERGMKIVFDLVLDHTSIEHPWFRESRADPDGPKGDWYLWHPGRAGGKKRPNNWLSITGGPAWHYDEERGEWFHASFLPFQPDLNYHQPAVKEAMFGVARHWLDVGVDGFRLDIFNCIFKDVELRDNPRTLRYIPREDNFDGFFQRREHTVDHPQNLELARELRRVTDAYDPARFTLGEIVGDHDNLKRYLGASHDGLDLVFLFQSLSLEMRADEIHDFLRELEEHYPEPYAPVMVYSNHDRRRSISRWRGDLSAARLAAFVQLTIRAVPVLYYGEEIGLPDGDFPARGGLDPLAAKYAWLPNRLARAVGVYVNRDGARTPMRFSGGKNGGFCPDDVEPWLPSIGGEGCDVMCQQADPRSLWNLYRDLLHLRRQNPALRSGSLELSPLDGSIIAYTRRREEQTLRAWANFGHKPRAVEIEASAELIFATNPSARIASGRLELPGRSGVMVGPSKPE